MAERAVFRSLVYPLALTVGVAFGAVLYGFSVLITGQGAGGEFSSSALSTAFGGSVLAGAAVVVPVGRFAGRHGIRAVLALGGALMGTGFVGFALAQTPAQVVAVWWLLIGPGSAMVLFDPAFIALEQWFERADRNRAAGTLTLLTGLAGPIFVPAVTLGVQGIGWRPTAALLGLLVAVVAWFTAGVALRRAPRPQATAAREPRSDAGRAIRATTTSFVLLSGSIALGMAALEAVNVHRLARFEATGFDAGILATWAAAASLASLPGRFFVPRLAIRWPAPQLLLGVTLLLVPAMALAIRGTSGWEMVSHFVLFGVLFGATIPMRTVVMGDWFAGPRFGALMGVQGAAIAVGRATGPSVVGWLRDLTGAYTVPMLLVTGLTVASGMLLAAAIRFRARGQ